ncbi:hypothetical protein CO009_03185 [Candidatus Shapirobacteria bacterium CG_4_8_14_3_um_filter_35_11]|uniref:BioF2-like acetyltransferase domain-containing protein n=6 Tax=Candidatus Shapironibacteriota TaxID=1752721 RepID=A0A1J5HMQ0_9BACT|nr:MAG: hypothetical protein AUK05_03270 [Candidatus Shapirobacteria bacterium CG2_30_35_20]PIV07088.1 MAG: hypothetical protein COS53_03155 [Candidatus Shapirobacteria bacterium CG03_land_8_20_14_0_80_35_14]PIX67764.1 MAG: hypothetical protein COZ41_03240 [Candidatus Shapirobacteria bacterium CG_4_10_14_3_um_filter_35_13]PJA50957.1 MAG: hypothetical protein CO168_02350 [Candidatus Shapirobacteria bacterium CG_4_9_14_3_um_filter_36_12]PJC79869.1 MAG: hypothetical protein CO009_03185 [Candidatus
MEIKEIIDKKTWNNYLIDFDDYTFLQSWQWGEINSNKEKVFRWVAIDGGVVGIVQAFTISAKRGKMLFVPHGPLVKSDKAWEELILVLKNKAVETNCVCLRISPWELREEKNIKKYIGGGFVESGVIMHAEDTWIVDLTGNEEEVMQRMRKTTRNLVRRGMRENIEINQSLNIVDAGYLYDLQMEVVKRNNFVPFSKAYLKKELEILCQDDMAKLFLGKGEGGIMGAALIVFLGKYAFYYQSGSRESKQPINYLLQWKVIKEARRRGCEKYNMWGVAPEGAKNHPWQGLTMFKMGFGGEMKQYMKSMDYPINRWKYFKLRLMEKIPKTWRSRLTRR